MSNGLIDLTEQEEEEEKNEWNRRKQTDNHSFNN